MDVIGQAVVHSYSPRVVTRGRVTWCVQRHDKSWQIIISNLQVMVSHDDS